MNKLDLLIIQKIKPYESLYNQNHEQHRQIEYRDLIWNTIAKELNVKGMYKFQEFPYGLILIEMFFSYS